MGEFPHWINLEKYTVNIDKIKKCKAEGGVGGIIEISIYRLSKYTAPARVSSVNDTDNGAPGASSLSMG